MWCKSSLEIYHDFRVTVPPILLSPPSYAQQQDNLSEELQKYEWVGSGLPLFW